MSYWRHSLLVAVGVTMAVLGVADLAAGGEISVVVTALGTFLAVDGVFTGVESAVSSATDRRAATGDWDSEKGASDA